MRDDFVKELLAKLDRAVPQRRSGVSRSVPPELGAVCNEGLYDYFMLRLDEIVRAGLRALAQMQAKEFLALVKGVEKLKPGPGKRLQL